MHRRSVLFILAATLLATDIQVLPAQSSPTDRQISGVRGEWVKDWNTKNLQALLALYAQDAVLLPSSGQRITGRVAIGQYLKQVMDASATDLAVTSINTEKSGELAYDSGSFQYSVKGGGGASLSPGAGITAGAGIGGGGGHRVEGNYLLVLKRQPAGIWLIVQHASTEVPTK